MAPTAARSAVAQVPLKGADPVPITSLGSLSSSGAIMPGKDSLVLLVPDAAVAVLHLQHPLQVPNAPRSICRACRCPIREFERNALDPVSIDLPGPKQHTGGDPGVDDVASVVTRIMPAANVVARPFGSRGGAEFAMQVAGGVASSRETRRSRSTAVPQRCRRRRASPDSRRARRGSGLRRTSNCVPRRERRCSRFRADVIRRSPRPAPDPQCPCRPGSAQFAFENHRFVVVRA